jgi:protein-S-isoprenylcysteine O-methyltransferase Ste14
LKRPALYSLLFVLFVGPGPVMVVVPGFLAGWRVHSPIAGFQPLRWLGFGLMALAAPVLAESVVRFVRKGHGTPAPVLPPTHLVVSGAYRYVRNPMYVAIVVALVGEGLALGSVLVLGYSVAVAVAFDLFISLYEEPHLRKVFGTEYEEYRRGVRRWLPSLRARAPSR